MYTILLLALRIGGGYGVGGERLFFTDGGPTVAGTNPAVVAVFARALTTFSQCWLLTCICGSTHGSTTVRAHDKDACRCREAR